jgi:hypothetical protein
MVEIWRVEGGLTAPRVGFGDFALNPQEKITSSKRHSLNYKKCFLIWLFKIGITIKNYQGIRISLGEDRRIFTPIDRTSYKWEKEYDHRTAVERVNSRLDVSFGFELHTIRGMAKMKLRCGLALCVMLAMALGRIREKQVEKMRSLVG